MMVIKQRRKTNKMKEAPLHVEPPREESKASVGLKLPKFSVPTFDRDMMNWSNFWDLFLVSIHDKTALSDIEKYT